MTEIEQQREKKAMEGLNLKEATIQFVHDRCTDLGYDAEKTAWEEEKGINLGKSMKENQIPYNQQMDIDRLCLENALKRFLDSGAGKDAFDVYFCYMEMFIGNYGSSRMMVELLSEFESNGSSVLLKHRDHYAHSVYVFCLGLAVFETNENFREIYTKEYHIEEGADSKEAAHHFLKTWGLTSLFHDIGYPMELPFEQVASYFEVSQETREGKPYLAYHSMNKYAEEMTKKLAKNVTRKLGADFNFTFDYMRNVIKTKPRHPEEFGYIMDHGYFSAVILYKRVFEEAGIVPSQEDLDAMSAILLHNKIFKLCIGHCEEKKGKNLNAEQMPLAYLLMLCDELQSWDRIAYGRNSRTTPLPMDCRLEFENGRITATYIYDEKLKFKEANMKKKAAGRPKFDEKIASIVNTKMVGLSTNLLWEAAKPPRKKTYLSNSNFLNLYDFAVALNGRWSMGKEWKKEKEINHGYDFLLTKMNDFTEAFEKLSLEYQLTNINQAKSFDEYLNAIGAFYTDRPVDFPELTEFTEKECQLIGQMEHERWLNEHMEMGWKYGKATGDKRELDRVHKDMMKKSAFINGKVSPEAAKQHYTELTKNEKEKDVEPMNAMLALLRMYDGVRVYRLPK